MRDLSNIIKAKDLADLSRITADIIVQEGQKAIARDGRYIIALSGGRTPQPLYSLLGESDYAGFLNQENIYIFFTDERCVHPSDENSNYGTIKDILLNKIPQCNVFRMKGEFENPAEAAKEYESTIINVFKSTTTETPRFDLMLLGIGLDGHVASIFPESFNINKETGLVISSDVKAVNSHRISLSMRLINNSRKIIFILNGRDKNNLLYSVKNNDFELPASFVVDNKCTTYWISSNSK